MQVKVKQLHLAAYMKANGANFIELSNGYFLFESDIPISKWRVSHSSSCCKNVDHELIKLRNLLHKEKNNG